MGLLYKKAANCSLAEAAKVVYVRGTEQLTLWTLDRNYDPVRLRDRMISTDQIKSIQDQARGPGHHVVLSPNKLSPQAKKELVLELFLFDELMIELPKHELVMKHTVVSEAEVKSYLGPSLHVKDLPVLPTSDPVARWFGFKAGTLLQIENPVMPSWRIVV